MSSDFSRSLNKFAQDIQDKAKELHGKQASFSELFHHGFMQAHTKFSTIDELFEAGGYHIGTAEDFQAIQGNAFDEYIKVHTSFDSWDEMMTTAGNELVLRHFKK